MKNKRLVILLSVFAFLVLIVVLCSTVFTVKKVQLQWLTTKVNFSSTDNEVASDVKKGDSVFLVDKKEITKKLEDDFPYIKVVSLEIKFPNKLIIHSAERQELFDIKVKDNSHYILDGECKVLRASNDANVKGAIPVTVTNYAFPDGTFSVSQVADLGYVSGIMNNLYKALLTNGYENVDMISNISAVQIDVTGYNENLEIKMGGVTIKVSKITSNLFQKLNMAVATFDTKLSTVERQSGTLNVYEKDGKVIAEYQA